MEQYTNMPVVTKKAWNIVRVMFYMLRKGIISKKKLMLDLNLMMKRGKIVGKSIHNLVFPSQHKTPNPLNGHVSSSHPEYEFSCSNTPVFFKRKNPKHVKHSLFFACVHAPNVDDDVATAKAVKKAFKIFNADLTASPAFWMDAHDVLASPAFSVISNMASSPALSVIDEVAASPAFSATNDVVASPAFWKNADVARARRVRITDSPFPLCDVDEDRHVDEAAEEFISRFYKQLRRQD